MNEQSPLMGRLFVELSCPISFSLECFLFELLSLRPHFLFQIVLNIKAELLCVSEYSVRPCPLCAGGIAWRGYW